MPRIGHYYGDIVRRLFIVAALVMLASLPFLQSFVPLPTFFAILAILIIVLAAGFLAPTQKWMMLTDMIISGAAVLVFEDYAVQAYLRNGTAFFVANQALAIIFFIAFYFAVKTVRGAFFKDGTVE